MMTREQWLKRMTTLMRPMFRAAHAPLPAKIRVSCGWPSGGALATAGTKNRTIGQCWHPDCSADGTTEIFISPCIAHAIGAAPVLAHELCHAALTDPGHGPVFKRLAEAIGLQGKMTETTCGPELAERLLALIARIGPYPHAVLDSTKSGVKKQGTRMLKITCPECGYTARAASKWIETGVPTCPCGTEMQAEVPADDPPEDE